MDEFGRWECAKSMGEQERNAVDKNGRTIMIERRQLPRWEVKKEVKVLFPQTQGINHCIIEDMHLKGMQISFNERLLLIQPMRMSFALGGEYDFIKIEAKIPWLKEGHGRYFYGLLFTKIDEEDKDKMYQYITANCYDQFKRNWWTV